MERKKKKTPPSLCFAQPHFTPSAVWRHGKGITHCDIYETLAEMKEPMLCMPARAVEVLLGRPERAWVNLISRQSWPEMVKGSSDPEIRSGERGLLKGSEELRG